ncbi:hypothetical protein QTH97_22830 [Variovorax sp. J22R24]|uniref:hypothetical protein n=1 Tax=Variovorax gracilis TaxID=3053502 RepID=UPI0025785162|nr:hypothetical protein [Variovorax sp. J22R24]MDM0107799.1 hypothetical protein [Variovorax sp. J22R24]
MESAIWGFIGTLIGALASIGTNIVTSRNAAALQSTASKLAREEQRRVFQRETLLKLQDELHALLRLTARMQIADKESFRRTSQWGAELLPDDLSNSEFEKTIEVKKLVERVDDEALRGDLKTLLAVLAEFKLAETEAQADNAFNTAVAVGNPAIERIGAALRSQY